MSILPKETGASIGAQNLPPMVTPDVPLGGPRDLASHVIPDGPGGLKDLAAAANPDALKDLAAAANPGALKDLAAAANPGALKDLAAAANPGALKDLASAANPGAPGGLKDLPASGLAGLSGGGLAGDRPMFTFTAGGVAGLRVVRIHGHEGLSHLFEFRVELAGPEVALDALVDRPALLQIDRTQVPRFVHGMVGELEYVGQTSELHLYEATLVPWIWRLQHRRTCRIFQDRTTPQIIEEVLTSAGLAKDWLRMALTATYAPRNYCVQYHETDLAFICRLMEEDGIFYFFEHSADSHVLLLGDHAGNHRPIPGDPALWFKPIAGQMVSDREHVREFRFSERVRPGQVVLRDFNLHQPGLAMEVKESNKSHTELEVYTYPGDYQDPALGGPHTGGALAKLRLEGYQTHRRVGAGASDCPRLTAGHTFSLVGHPRAEFDTNYRILSVTHTGNQPQSLGKDAAGDSSYANEFRVNELKAPYRPLQQTPKPVMRGLQSATVVGPPEEEVHTDEHGRVKVQFHWDRVEPFDDTSSCWVRVSQVWAGNGWGAMFLPRVGHEVLVDFMEGDPDRPIVVGRVYTGTNAPPYPLPEQKTRSTIKSESSTGGGGFNELRFEDRKGSEEVFLHAQKDFNTKILSNHSESVGASRSSTIGGSETITVGASRTSTISAGETVSVGAARTVTVGGSDTTTVGAVHTVTIVAAPPPPPAPGEPPPAPVAPTSSEMRDKFYSVTTGPATITLDGPNMYLVADGDIVIRGRVIHLNPPSE
jgi:type VI secretion system secreted protein VgrG